MNWHARYTQQAHWTASLRAYIFQKAGLAAARRILEVGCGTGALLQEFPAQTAAAVHGVDLSLSSIKQASIHAPNSFPLTANGQFLPYPRDIFDLSFCHYLLLWVSDPAAVLAEMKRVTRPGGAVLALAEPDYGGRVDFPPALAELGRWQTESLRKQGAQPEMGRQLAGIFAHAGLKSIETGVMGGMWTAPPSLDEWNLEWEVIKSDLTGQVALKDLQKMENLDRQAWKNGTRVLFVPTFYAWGLV